MADLPAEDEDKSGLTSRVSVDRWLQWIDSDALKYAVTSIPDEILSLEEEELRKKFSPTRTDYALRHNLWSVLRILPENPRIIKPIEICGGICSGTHWYSNILTNPYKLAWHFTPLNNYEEMLEPLLVRSTERLYEFLNLNIYDRKGKPNPSLVRAVLDVIKLIENRVRGESIQRIESKNLNISSSPEHKWKLANMDDLNAKIAELESELKTV